MGATNAFGVALYALAFLCASWFWYAVQTGRLDAGVTPTRRLAWLAWLVGSALFAIAAGLIQLAFEWFEGAPPASLVQGLFELGAALGIGWACFMWWLHRVKPPR